MRGGEGVTITWKVGRADTAAERDKRMEEHKTGGRVDEVCSHNV